MLGSVAGHADDGVLREEPTGDGNGHVGLADVHAIGAHSKRDVEAVVDEDGDIVLAAYILGAAGNFEELSAGSTVKGSFLVHATGAYLARLRGFLSYLYERHATLQRLYKVSQSDHRERDMQLYFFKRLIVILTHPRTGQT